MEEKSFTNQPLFWLTAVLIPIVGLLLSFYDIIGNKERNPSESLEIKAEKTYAQALKFEMEGNIAQALATYNLLVDLYAQEKTVEKTVQAAQKKLQMIQEKRPDSLATNEKSPALVHNAHGSHVETSPMATPLAQHPVEEVTYTRPRHEVPLHVQPETPQQNSYLENRRVSEPEHIAISEPKRTAIAEPEQTPTQRIQPKHTPLASPESKTTQRIQPKRPPVVPPENTPQPPSETSLSSSCKKLWDEAKTANRKEDFKKACEKYQKLMQQEDEIPSSSLRQMKKEYAKACYYYARKVEQMEKTANMPGAFRPTILKHLERSLELDPTGTSSENAKDMLKKMSQ